MNKPTKAQIKEFWEWCGCEIKATKLNGSPAWSIYFPDNRCETNYLGEESQSLTLDNLFKYAVPPLPIKYRHPILENWVLQLTDNYEEDALALFWAIDEVIK